MKPKKLKNETVVAVEKTNSNNESMLEVPTDLNKRTKSVMEAINNATKKKNESFGKMTMMEKRVALAKDVLASIKAKKYISSPGTYVSLIKNKCGYDDSIDHTMENLMDTQVTCEVCAIGSLFVSKFKLTKKTEFDGMDDDDMIASMSGIFGMKALRKLEYFFEGRDVADEFSTDAKLEDDVLSFTSIKANRDPETRLVSIMQNIIDNNGNFIYGNTKV